MQKGNSTRKNWAENWAASWTETVVKWLHVMHCHIVEGEFVLAGCPSPRSRRFVYLFGRTAARRSSARPVFHGAVESAAFRFTCTFVGRDLIRSLWWSRARLRDKECEYLSKFRLDGSWMDALVVEEFFHFFRYFHVLRQIAAPVRSRHQINALTVKEKDLPDVSWGDNSIAC